MARRLKRDRGPYGVIIGADPATGRIQQPFLGHGFYIGVDVAVVAPQAGGQLTNAADIVMPDISEQFHAQQTPNPLHRSRGRL